MRSRDRTGRKETRLIAQHARSARTTAGIHLVTAKYDQQVDRRWQYQHSSSGLRSLRLRLRVCNLQGWSWQRPKDGSVGVVWTLERRTTAELQFQRNETMDGTGKARQGIAAVAIYLQVPDVCAFARPKATNRQRKWKKALQTKSCSFLHRQLERCLGLPLLRCVAYENPLRDSCCLPSPPGTLESTRHLM